MDQTGFTNKIPFIGSGWSFPPTFERSTGGMEMQTGDNDIRDSLVILLGTAPGERKMNPEYGCDLTPLLFESLSLSLRKRMSEKIQDAILRFEPRILVDNVTFDVRSAPTGAEVRLEYQEVDILHQMMKKVHVDADENYEYPYQHIDRPGEESPSMGLPGGGATDNVIYINVLYLVRRTNTRHNLVYPFYLKEATNL